MVISKSEKKKIDRKLTRCIKIVQKEHGVEVSQIPTCSLLIGNGGLICGVDHLMLLELFEEFGSIRDIATIPDKSYSFVVFHQVASAQRAYDILNGKQVLGEEKRPIYLAFLKQAPKAGGVGAADLRFVGGGQLPPGAILVQDFVNEEEEQQLLSCISDQMEEEEAAAGIKGQSLKNRLVCHFGYAFNYDTNNVDPERPIPDQPIPEACHRLLERCLQKKLIHALPDQLTVNRYSPGQGIPQHTDTHSAFEGAILSLSLSASVAMEFRHPLSEEHLTVQLPRRSLLVMAEESRFVWTHGISCRKNDLVSVSLVGLEGEDDANSRREGEACEGETGRWHLTLQPRQVRTSFTFRKIRRQGGCTCRFADYCESQTTLPNSVTTKNSLTSSSACDSSSPSSLNVAEMCPIVGALRLTEEQAKILETKHVGEVYDAIADHFSATRHKPWPRIAAFLDRLSCGALLVDVGCGNGKYLGQHPAIAQLGCDLSGSLLEICRSRDLEVVQSNVLQLPFRDGSADACLCIAVLHHLATPERRCSAVKEIIRVLRPGGGQALIYVWALEQEDLLGNPTNYIQPKRRDDDPKQREVPLQESLQEGGRRQGQGRGAEEAMLRLPVHVNRTPFAQQDLLVPWKSLKKTAKKIRIKDGDGSPLGPLEPPEVEEREDNKVVLERHRFYHVFAKGELEALVLQSSSFSQSVMEVTEAEEMTDAVEVTEAFYDKGNWGVLLRKK